MWLKRVIGLCAIGLGIGILVVLFLPTSVIFFLIAMGLLIVGYISLFC